MNLSCDRTRIAPENELDPGRIVQSGQCFRAQAMGDGLYRFIARDALLYMRVLEPGVFSVSCSEDVWNAVWRPYFDLDRDYAAIRRAIPPEDGFLRAAAREGVGLRVLRQDPFETLTTFILSQRKNIPAIRAAVEKLCAAFGSRIEGAPEELYAFPTPEQLCAASEEELRACALGYRAPYVADAARRVAEGRLDLKSLSALPDEALDDALQSVYGVGRKVSACVALFAYGRVTRVPVDTWIRQIIEGVYGGRNPFPAYGENAGIYQQYMFDYAVRHKREIAQAVPSS